MRLIRCLPRALLLALYLLQGGILLPLHHHAEPAADGPQLGSGCHQGLPCSESGHRHPDPPSDHPRACVACAAALRPIAALGQMPLPLPSLTQPAAEPVCQCPALSLSHRCPSERAPPPAPSS